MRSAGLRILLLAGLSTLAGAGCARLFSHYDVAPNGLHRSDDRLRRLLMAGQPDSALTRVTDKGTAAPDDELLRSLYAGILAHYAGAYDSSNAALQRAADLAEDRYTKSVSRAALSLVTSDRTLAYEPGWTERLLIHYYGALNRLRQRDTEGAAVEARRLASLLEREEERARDPRTTPLLALLRTFTGVVFEAAGEWNDADVAYRNALRQAPRGDSLLTLPPLPDTLGEVVVLIERGYVAHRVEQSVIVPLHPVEVHWLTESNGEDRALAITEIAARIIAEGLLETTRRPRYARRPSSLYVEPPSDEFFKHACHSSKDGNGKKGDDDARERCPSDGNPYILRIAWPTYRLDREPTRRLNVVVGDTILVPTGMRADVSPSVIRDFEDERAWLVARTLARATSKLALAKGIENSLEGGDKEWIGRSLGMLTNVGTALLEQADTRSWQLLPARLELARLRLPPGSHPIAVEVSGHGRIDLGAVQVLPRTIEVFSARIWD